ncbi:TetR/AcrR family transcriptional regulator [Cryptosporangium sp. NPDC051539]|uniref:TetR/AcrR family transcriptional regulator n=1 Tax=Cryptosporangium sp. NPDC051539 TaxID=3363962 RepID=UPI0037B89686
MAAQLRADARDNRERIVEVARVMFARDGLDVPIREIARRASVGPATVYRHFPTKEALLTAAFADEMALCSDIVEEGLAVCDPWDGFAFVIARLLEVHALNRGFSRAFTSEPAGLGAERDRSLRGMLELIRRAKDAGALRADFVLEDAILVLMANEGIRADSPQQQAAASRRFAALMLQSFRPDPGGAPLPPPVRLPLAAR